MLSAVKRYRFRLSGALARYFPRTAEYLREQGSLHSPLAPTSKPRAGKKSVKTSASKAVTDKTKPTSAGRKRATPGIYSAKPMDITPAHVQAMRDKVAAAVQAGVISQPSDEQWAMIVCESPLTRIFAGAGSGKSTTLVLRVVFMLCHMGIEVDKLCVISFTSASCAELRERLIKLLRFWQYPFDATQARATVRTFHSAMGVMAKASLGNPQWFEQLGARGASAGELDNPLTGARLQSAQLNLLNDAYQQCYSEVAEFRELVHSLLQLPVPQQADTPDKAPMAGFKLNGEFKPAPLPEAFYAQAQFIESIGITIADIQPQKLQCAEQERTFIKALQQFNGYFMATLQAHGLMTFNCAFAQLSAMLTAPEEGTVQSVASAYSHLLVDEFQDISPQIVQWLQALHRHLNTHKQPVSLMAIGDDWQSIYAWRGSSPELFMNFDVHFPCKPKTRKSQVLMLETNYRSIAPIVKDAQNYLQAVACKQDKAATAVRNAQSGDHGLKHIRGFDLSQQLPQLIKQITQQCEYAAQCNSSEATAVLLLSRRNEPLKRIKAQLDKGLAVKCMTIHRAKGLQAQVAIILDDGATPVHYALRNALYQYCGFFSSSYDQAMADEAQRLGYVAITRAVSRAYWYSKK